MSSAFASGLLAGYGIAVPVGAIAILIVTRAARSSFRQGFAAGLGAATADLIYATIAVAAGTGLDHQLRAVQTPLHIAGGCVLAAIALRGLTRTMRAPTVTVDARAESLTGTYLRFVGLTLINPLTVVYFASVVFGNESMSSPTRATAFVVGVAIASASWQTLLAASGALIGRVFVEKVRIATALLGYGIVFALAIHQFQLG